VNEDFSDGIYAVDRIKTHMTGMLWTVRRGAIVEVYGLGWSA